MHHQYLIISWSVFTLLCKNWPLLILLKRFLHSLIRANKDKSKPYSYSTHFNTDQQCARLVDCIAIVIWGLAWYDCNIYFKVTTTDGCVEKYYVALFHGGLIKTNKDGLKTLFQSHLIQYWLVMCQVYELCCYHGLGIGLVLLQCSMIAWLLSNEVSRRTLILFKLFWCWSASC